MLPQALHSYKCVSDSDFYIFLKASPKPSYLTNRHVDRHGSRIVHKPPGSCGRIVLADADPECVAMKPKKNQRRVGKAAFSDLSSNLGLGMFPCVSQPWW